MYENMNHIQMEVITWKLYLDEKARREKFTQEMEDARNESTEYLSGYVSAQKDANIPTKSYRLIFGEPIKIVAKKRVLEERLIT